MKETRTCMVCRQKNNKNQLIRIAKDKNCEAIYDKEKIKSGRGIYFCNNPKCLNMAIKNIGKNKFNIKSEINKQSLKEVLEKILVELGE